MKDGFTFWHGVFIAGALIAAVALFTGLYPPAWLGGALAFVAFCVITDE